MRRDELIALLERTLEERSEVEAAWLGGSDAFGRADEHSDVDLIALTPLESEEGVFGAVERALAPLGAHIVLPMPTWHGSPQRFYRSEGAPDSLFVDFVLVREEFLEELLEPHRHGTPAVLFDRGGRVRPRPGDPDRLRAELARVVADLRERSPLTFSLVRKELARGNATDAVAFYHNHTLRPLVTVLRVRHSPWRHDFGLRYVEHDLPREVFEELRELLFVRDAEHLARCHARAEELFQRTVSELDVDVLEL